MARFKVGDRVHWAGNPNMMPDSGTIIEIKGSNLLVKWDSDGMKLFIESEEVTLIPLVDDIREKIRDILEAHTEKASSKLDLILDLMEVIKCKP